MKVKKVVKTMTTRTVQPVPMGPDGLPVDASAVSNNYIQTLGRDFRKNGNGGPGPYVGQAGTSTILQMGMADTMKMVIQVAVTTTAVCPG